MDAVNRMDKAAVVSQVAGYAYGGQVGVPVYIGGGSSATSSRGDVNVEFTGQIVTADPQEAARAFRSELSWGLGGLS
jgi:hypothetical protein